MEKKVLLKDLVDSGTNLRKQITSKVRVSDQGVYPIGEIWDANTTINTIVDGASIAFDTLKEVEQKLEQHDAQIAAEVARATAAEEAEKKRAIAVSEKGVANGVATLDSSGKVPSSQLPSYVDDVIEGYYNNGKFYENYTEGAGHDYVEIGGVKWATMNIGAENITDGGLYFQWGDTQGYIASQVGEGDGKKYFGWADYKFNPSGDGSTLTKYNNTDGKTILESSDDAVTAAWGNDWRMPTSGELQNLGNAVIAVYTQIDGVSGLKCTAKTDNTKELFFPQVGFAHDGSVSLLEGNYWSSLISNTDTKYAYRLLFRWNQTNWCEHQNSRTLGYQVRGVYTGNLPSGGGYSDELTPETGKIYVDIQTNQSYRWSGSTYIVISSPYVLPTASVNTLGGVKVGDGLSIDSNGVLSAEGGKSIEVVQTTGNSTTAVISLKGITDIITENEEVVSTALNDLNDRMIENEEIVSTALNDLNDRISSSPSINAYTKTETDLLLSNKIDKVSGKGLSTNDYTTEEKNKLASIVAFSGNYKDLTFNISTASVSGVVSIDGTIPVHVLTATDNIYDLKLSSNPTNGHTCRVIIKTTNTEKTRVVVKKNSNIVFPDNTDIISAIPINGYVEIDFLAVGGKVYVYGVLNPDYPMIVVNVTTTSSPTKIINNTSSISKLIIDGVEQPSVVESYQFTTTGYHFIECNFVNDVIGESAFYGCSSIKYITIPDSVTTIGNSAFLNCYKLTSIDIPDSVTSIGENAFYSCINLTSVTIGNSVTTIGKSAFENCTFTNINIPDSVTSIGSGAFAGCTFTSINIPDGVTSIRDHTFLNCNKLTSINIPNSITSIGAYAFSGCNYLTSITIPDSVTTIDYSAFYNCTGLTSITIGNSVTSISGDAFNNCTSLTNITCNATTAPTIQRNTFNNVHIDGTLTVPANSTGYDTWMSTDDYYLGKYNWTMVEL